MSMSNKVPIISKVLAKDRVEVVVDFIHVPLSRIKGKIVTDDGFSF